MEIWLGYRSYHFTLTIQSTLHLTLIQKHLWMCFLALNWGVYVKFSHNFDTNNTLLSLSVRGKLFTSTLN